MSLAGQGRSDEDGYAMAALLVSISIMAVMMSVALPVWRTAVQRERETELIFRGRQYARAVALYQRKFANAYPPSVDVLLNGRFLRKKYLDPITNSDFQVLYGAALTAQRGQPQGAGPARPGQPQSPRPGGAPMSGGGMQSRPATGGGTFVPANPGAGPVGAPQGIVGVASKSTAASMRLYNGRNKYNEWTFLAQDITQQIGAPPNSLPGQPGSPPGQRVPGPGGNVPGSVSRPGLQLPGRLPAPSATFPTGPRQ